MGNSTDECGLTKLGGTSFDLARRVGPCSLFLLVAVSVFFCLSEPSSKAAETNEEAQLIATLQSTASPAEKDTACARLKFIGTPRCVPALAALLADEQLSHSARYALESMHFEEAGRALLNALPGTTGPVRVGIINSLGVRHERSTVPALSRLLSQADSSAALAAAHALGEIGDPAAVSALQSAATTASGPLHVALVDAELRRANLLLSSGDPSKARSLFDRLYRKEKSDTVCVAAYRGLILSSGKRGPKLVVRGIIGPSGPAQLAALQLVAVVEAPDATDTLARLLRNLSPDLQVVLIDGLAQRGDPAAAPAIARLAASPDAQVQLSVIRALGALGNASNVTLLADFAASGTPEQQKDAREALAELRRGKVDEMLVEQLATSGTNVQAELVHALGARTARSALPSLFHLAQEGSPNVRRSALQAIGFLVDNPQLPSLVELLLQTKDAEARAEAAEALNVACQHVRSRRGQVEVKPLVAALAAGSPDARVALLPVCSSLPDPKIRAALRLALQDSNALVRQAAIRAACDTIDVELLDDLVTLAVQNHEQNFRTLAIAAAVRLTIDEKAQLTNGQRVAALRELLASADHPEQKRLVFSGLAEVADADALRVVEPELADPAVQAEASLAAIKIATGLPSTEAQTAEAVLQKGLASATTDATRHALDSAIQQIEANADYISDWQVAGPYRQTGKNYDALFDIVFPPELEDPKGVTWKYIPAGVDPTRPWAMDMAKALGAGAQCVGYARTWIRSDQDQPAVLELGSDDGVKAWINDKQVYALNIARALRPASDKVPVNLHSGWNQVLLKITQNNQGWEFCARLRKPDGSHIEGLQFQSAPKVPSATTGN
jgi:HEAT repeat protein